MSKSREKNRFKLETGSVEKTFNHLYDLLLKIIISQSVKAMYQSCKSNSMLLQLRIIKFLEP
jgi:hypothetical protein